MFYPKFMLRRIVIILDAVIYQKMELLNFRSLTNPRFNYHFNNHSFELPMFETM